MRQPRKGRVYGPYPSRDGFRVVAIPRPGERLARVFATEAQANEWIAITRDEFDQAEVILKTAIKLYREDQTARGVQEQSLDTTRYRLHALFRDELETPVSELTRKRCQAAYDRLAAAWKVDTHRNALSEGRKFLGWCHGKRMTSENPLAHVEGRGQRSRGKAQLRIDEARAVMRTAVALVGAGDRGALAALIALVLGLRAGEIARIVARDVDDEGRLLWVPKSKTKAGVRRLEIPDLLREAMAPLVPKAGPLFPDCDRHWVRYHVGRVCRLAGVDEVSAHGLRGTHATLADDHGTSGQQVAASLGHADDGRTADRHYINPVTAGAAKRRATFRVLSGGAP